MSNKRNGKTTHPEKTRRRKGALARLIDTPAGDAKQSKRRAYEIAALELRIGKPPRSWPDRAKIATHAVFGAA